MLTRLQPRRLLPRRQPVQRRARPNAPVPQRSVGLRRHCRLVPVKHRMQRLQQRHFPSRGGRNPACKHKPSASLAKGGSVCIEQDMIALSLRAEDKDITSSGRLRVELTRHALMVGRPAVGSPQPLAACIPIDVPHRDAGTPFIRSVLIRRVIQPRIANHEVPGLDLESHAISQKTNQAPEHLVEITHCDVHGAWIARDHFLDGRGQAVVLAQVLRPVGAPAVRAVITRNLSKSTERSHKQPVDCL